MTIRGNWGVDFVKQSQFKVEHLERLLEQMKEPIVLGNEKVIDWDAFKHFCLLVSEDKPESIENE